MRTREPLTLLVGMWNSAAGSPQKAKSRVTVGPRHPFLGFIPKRSESVRAHKHGTRVVMAALFIMSKRQKPLGSPSVEEWASEM